MSALDYERIAHLYDVYVRTDLDIPFFLAEAQKAGGPVLELMAGTGRVSLPLLEAGIDLTCVDGSAAMLDVLRAKLRDRGFRAAVVQADVCELSLNQRFAQIFIAFHSFAEITDPADQRRALQHIGAHLADSGRFICTLHNPPARLRGVTGQMRQLGNFALADEQGTLSLSSVEYYDPRSQLVTGTQFYEVHGEDDAVLWRTALSIRFSLHTQASLGLLAESAGLTPVAFYGDYSGAAFDAQKSPFMISVWRRAESRGSTRLAHKGEIRHG